MSTESNTKIVKSTGWNVLGLLLPLLMALTCTPFLLDSLGVIRFGILSIFWAIIGYLSIFDLGVSRSLAKLVSESLSLGRIDESKQLVVTGLAVLLFIGFVISILLGTSAGIITSKILRIQPDIEYEIKVSIIILSFGVPSALLTTGIRGALEGYRRFAIAAFIRSIVGASCFLAPMIAILFKEGLIFMTGAMVIARLATAAVSLLIIIKVATLGKTFSMSKAALRQILNFGSWIAVSNFIGPFMEYMDRVFIAMSLSVSSVAFYAVPFDIVTRTRFLPGALMGVLFPELSSDLKVKPFRAEELCRKAIKYIFLAMFPIVIVFIFFADIGLTLWLGAEFANNSFVIMKLL